MNNEKRILCRDCDFYRKNIDEADAASCYHPAALANLDHVNGFDEYNSCRYMRSTGPCKISAEFFKKIGSP